MLTLRQRIFVIISIIVSFILAGILFLLFRKTPAEETPAQADTQTVNQTPETATVRPGQRIVSFGSASLGSQDGSAEITTELDPALYARQLTRIFVERFATYSNQNDNTHIEDVLGMSTSVMIQWLETQRLDQSLEYEGVTTRVVSSEVREESETRFLVGVDVQQELSSTSASETDGVQTELQQRKGRVEVIKVGAEWKINGFWWE